MIELAEGLYVAPEHVAMIKSVDEDSCLLFTVGQSALEGHLLPYSASEVAEAVDDYFEETVDEDEEIDDKDEEE